MYFFLQAIAQPPKPPLPSPSLPPHPPTHGPPPKIDHPTAQAFQKSARELGANRYAFGLIESLLISPTNGPQDGVRNAVVQRVPVRVRRAALLEVHLDAADHEGQPWVDGWMDGLVCG